MKSGHTWKLSDPETRYGRARVCWHEAVSSRDAGRGRESTRTPSWVAAITRRSASSITASSAAGFLDRILEVMTTANCADYSGIDFFGCRPFAWSRLRGTGSRVIGAQESRSQFWPRPRAQQPPPLPKATIGLRCAEFMSWTSIVGPPIRRLAREHLKRRIEASRSDSIEPSRPTPADSASALAATREALSAGPCGRRDRRLSSHMIEIVDHTLDPHVRSTRCAIKTTSYLLWRTKCARAAR